LKVASLDLGTNSFLCLISESSESGDINYLSDESIVTRLGQNVQKTGAIGKEALKRAEESFSSFKKSIDKFGVDKVMAVTTSAARDAENFSDLYDLGQNFGIPIKVISGEEEAELSFDGAVSTSEKENSLLIDIGGGSTEIAFFKDGAFTRKSLPLGSVRLGEMFVDDWALLNKDSLDRIREQIVKTLEVSFEGLKPPLKNWIAVAGTPTTLKAIQLKGFDPDKINGSSLLRSDISLLVSMLIDMPLEKRHELQGLDKKRADVIPVGAKILDVLLEWCNVEKVTVSTRGLRYGLAKKLLDKT